MKRSELITPIASILFGTKQRFVFLTCVLLFPSFSGCRSIYLSELSPQGEIQTKLPPLSPIMDIRSLEDAFGIYNTSSDSYSTGGVIFNTPYVNTTTNSTTYRNQSIKDLDVIFTRDVQNNICETYGNTKGYITCRITEGGSSKKGGGFTFLSWVLGYCVTNLFGMPYATTKSAFEVQVNIYDRNQNLVGSYVSPYIAKKEFVALYYGYTVSDGKRKTAMTAFKACMNNIKRQINSDTQLKSRLD